MLLNTTNKKILEEYNVLKTELKHLIHESFSNDQKRKKWIESRLKDLEAIFNY